MIIFELLQHINKFKKVDEESIEISFQFKNNDGFIELCFNDKHCPKGWSVTPHQPPLKVRISINCYSKSMITFMAIGLSKCH